MSYPGYQGDFPGNQGYPQSMPNAQRVYDPTIHVGQVSTPVYPAYPTARQTAYSTSDGAYPVQRVAVNYPTLTAASTSAMSPAYAQYSHAQIQQHQLQQQQLQQQQLQQQQLQQQQIQQQQLQRQQQMQYEQQRHAAMQYHQREEMMRQQRLLYDHQQMVYPSTSYAQSPHGAPPVLQPQTTTAPTPKSKKNTRTPTQHRAPKYTLPVLNARTPAGTPCNRPLLAPFQLAHELSVSQHQFHLAQDDVDALARHAGLQVQVKCVHKAETPGMNSLLTNWPSEKVGNVQRITMSLEVNGTAVPIEGVNSEVHIKHLCRVGFNTLTIHVTKCCCSHLYVVQLVEELMPPYHAQLYNRCVEPMPNAKLRLRDMMRSLSASGVQVTQERLPLVCPLTTQPLQVPARGVFCRHVACFDAVTLLTHHAQTTREQPMKCPLCQQELIVEMIRVDGYVDAILKSVRASAVDHVLLDANAEWSIPGGVKTEHPTLTIVKQEAQVVDDAPPSAKRARPSESVASPPWTMLSPHAAAQTSPARAAYGKSGPFTPHTPVQLTSDGHAMGATVLGGGMGYGSETAAGSQPYTPRSVGSAGSTTAAHGQQYPHSVTSTGVGSNSSSAGASTSTAAGNDLDDLVDLVTTTHTSEQQWRELLSSTNLGDKTDIDEMVANYHVPSSSSSTGLKRAHRSIDAVESDELKDATKYILSLFD